jgi:hypothetical protein
MALNYGKNVAIPSRDSSRLGKTSLTDQLKAFCPGFVFAQIARYLGITTGPLANTKAWNRTIALHQQTVIDIRSLGAGLTASLFFYNIFAASRLSYSAHFYPPDDAQKRMLQALHAGPWNSLSGFALPHIKSFGFGFQAASIGFSGLAAQLRTVERTSKIVWPNWKGAAQQKWLPNNIARRC